MITWTSGHHSSFLKFEKSELAYPFAAVCELSIVLPYALLSIKHVELFSSLWGEKMTERLHWRLTKSETMVVVDHGPYVEPVLASGYRRCQTVSMGLKNHECSLFTRRWLVTSVDDNDDGSV